MFNRRPYLTLSALLLMLFSVGWFYNHSMANDNEDVYYKIDKGLFYLKGVFETVSRNYVDELDPEQLSRSAIQGMLDDFDPYTVFFEDPGSHQMRMITRGKYGGVGMEIGIQDNRITVIAPMDGTPARRAGIHAGDIISHIDGVSTAEMSIEDASRKLRGKVGTRIQLTVERPGMNAAITVMVEREEIVLKDVTFADFVAPGVAYLRLSAFSDKAGRELREAVRDLQSQQTIRSVVLDLRENPGGLLTAAVDVANVFLSPGQLIVSTRGSHETENRFFTKEMPLLPSEPLVVLVNEASASASEIVAGAIQDLDRGVLIGGTTFGKGLVQKVYPIDKVSQAYLKITTAKYYVPSGRSIQKEDYKKDNGVFMDRADSSEYDRKVDFFTKNGRIVHGGGGIQPDIEVANDDHDVFVETLTLRGYFFRFAVKYLSEHPEIDSWESFDMNDQVLAELRDFALDEGFDFQMAGEKELKDFLAIAGRKAYSPDVNELVDVALQKLSVAKRQQFEVHRKTLQRLLSAEFAQKLSGEDARIRTMISDDPQVDRALTVLENGTAYQRLLVVRK